MTPALRQSIGQYLPLVASVTLTGASLLVSQAVAAALDPGSVATLGFATKVPVLVVYLSAEALGTAVLPFFSKTVAAADWDQVRQTIRVYERVILLTAVPLTGVLVVFSEPIVALVFQRGAFTSADTALVARVQALYALQIPFYVLAMLYGRLLSSLGANRVYLWLAAIIFPLNAVLAVVLARVMGVAGIAVAATLSQIFAFCFFAILLRRTHVFRHELVAL